MKPHSGVLDRTAVPRRDEGCDGCGAPAFVQVVLESGRFLLLCGHHARRHESALAASGASLRDQIPLLVSPG